MSDSFLEITPEINKAIKDNVPVVALESTIISHGMPWPKNIETAMSVEEAVRKEGAIPATIAIINDLKQGIRLSGCNLKGYLSTRIDLTKGIVQQMRQYPKHDSIVGLCHRWTTLPH